ncbi:MAG: sugar O-acetyltransferase [Clostridia bacterium]|jgi:maltose O-acetyltransferase|nr:sugar O-acetyltransferase [Clostridia bacterium]MCI9459708.1 sugar O-acetyltransferase [Clostridia bacterium]
MNKDDFVIFAEPGDFPVDKVKRKNALLKKFHCECETIEERQAVLKELFGAVGRNPRVTPLFYCDLGFNIFIGDDFYSNYNLTILDCAKVTIGNNCYIADNVGIYAVGHPTDRLLRRADIEYGAPVVIGDDVWIGGHTVINPGVTIGDNVVIGSGSVVTRDIESGVVAAGNPCRVIRKIDERDRKYIFKDIEYPPELIEKHYGKNK